MYAKVTTKELVSFSFPGFGMFIESNEKMNLAIHYDENIYVDRNSNFELVSAEIIEDHINKTKGKTISKKRILSLEAEYNEYLIFLRMNNKLYLDSDRFDRKNCFILEKSTFYNII